MLMPTPPMRQKFNLEGLDAFKKSWDSDQDEEAPDETNDNGLTLSKVTYQAGNKH